MRKSFIESVPDADDEPALLLGDPLDDDDAEGVGGLLVGPLDVSLVAVILGEHVLVHHHRVLRGLVALNENSISDVVIIHCNI